MFVFESEPLGRVYFAVSAYFYVFASETESEESVRLNELLSVQQKMS